MTPRTMKLIPSRWRSLDLYSTKTRTTLHFGIESLKLVAIPSRMHRDVEWSDSRPPHTLMEFWNMHHECFFMQFAGDAEAEAETTNKSTSHS